MIMKGCLKSHQSTFMDKGLGTKYFDGFIKIMDELKDNSIISSGENILHPILERISCTVLAELMKSCYLSGGVGEWYTYT